MSKISVVIPVYNVEKYLGQCLDSVIGQTLKDIEIICVNDGSKDSSFDILREYSKQDERIIVIDKENSGYGDSLNIGFSAAKGEYISIIEPDDFIDLNMLEVLYDIAKKNDCEIAKCDWNNYWTKNNQSVKNGKILPEWTDKVVSCYDYPKILCVQPSVWSGLYKRSFLEENNIKFLTTPGASYQDTSFTFKIYALAKRIILTAKSYHYYRQDNEASSINNKNKADVIFQEYDEINHFLEQNKSLCDSFLTQKLHNEYYAYKWTVKRISPELRDDFIEKVSRRFKGYRENNKITDEFVSDVIGLKMLECLINDTKKYRTVIEKEIRREKFKQFRRNLVSVKINKARVSVMLLGKQIVSIG